jgi:hypothetical protein
MAEVLQLSVSTTAFSYSAEMRWKAALPAPIVIQPGMALEYQFRIGEGTPDASGLMFFSQLSTSTSFVDLPDQNGFKEGFSAPSNRIYEQAKQTWCERIISLDSLVGQTLFRVDLRVGLGPAGAYKHQFANVRITQFRKPIAYIWTQGMGVPMMADVQLTDPGSLVGAQICVVDLHEHFPLLCTTDKTPDRLVDSIQSNRTSGGSLRRWLEWAFRKDEFDLEFAALTELQRQQLVAFYDVYRGGDDWFLWQHRANYPAQRVTFRAAPEIAPVVINGGGSLRYRARVPIQEI